MSDGAAADASPTALPSAAATTAGRLLREARERQGLHIAALAASIKVTPKKLEMLEADRFDALPDATFTRALAQTVCRALKIDSAAVMKLLPPPSGHRLEQVGEGLNAPFRDRTGTLVQRDWSGLSVSPAFWITALILMAAAVVFFLPSGLTSRIASRATPASSPARVAVDDSASQPPPTFIAAPTVALPLASESSASAASTALAVAANPAASEAAGAPIEAAVTGLLQVRTSAESWVEISDARGQPLLARLLRAGETVGIDGTPPLRVRIGNASATRLSYRGQPTDLAAFTRDNVARLELK